MEMNTVLREQHLPPPSLNTLSSVWGAVVVVLLWIVHPQDSSAQSDCVLRYPPSIIWQIIGLAQSAVHTLRTQTPHTITHNDTQLHTDLRP